MMLCHAKIIKKNNGISKSNEIKKNNILPGLIFSRLQIRPLTKP